METDFIDKLRNKGFSPTGKFQKVIAMGIRRWWGLADLREYIKDKDMMIYRICDDYGISTVCAEKIADMIIALGLPCECDITKKIDIAFME